VALAITAGTTGLCASAPAAGRSSAYQHIDRENQVLEQKKGRGFTALLKASAVNLGKSLMRQVQSALVRKHAQPHRIARNLPVREQKWLSKGHRYRSPLYLRPHTAILNGFMWELISEMEVSLLPGRLRPPLVEPGAMKSAQSRQNLNRKDAQRFCAQHKDPVLIRFFAIDGLAIYRLAPFVPSIAPSMSGLVCLFGQSECEHKDGQINGISRVCMPEWVAESAQERSPRRLGRGEIQELISPCPTEFDRLRKHFPIDPVRATALLAHGAVGARNALRGDRSRDNRAQSV
jgi:hypothetical protein